MNAVTGILAQAAGIPHDMPKTHPRHQMSDFVTSSTVADSMNLLSILSTIDASDHFIFKPPITHNI